MSEMIDNRAVVLLSGGLDSFVAAGLAREAGMRLYALTIDYNQRHRIELESARAIAASLRGGDRPARYLHWRERARLFRLSRLPARIHRRVPGDGCAGDAGGRRGRAG